MIAQWANLAKVAYFVMVGCLSVRTAQHLISTRRPDRLRRLPVLPAGRPDREP
jgi:uncharacterized membrane protein